MPSKTPKQRRFMGAVLSCKTRGECPSDKIQKAANGMTISQIKDFLRTKTNKKLKTFKEFFDEKQMLIEQKCQCKCLECKTDCSKCDCDNCNCEGCKCNS